MKWLTPCIVFSLLCASTMSFHVDVQETDVRGENIDERARNLMLPEHHVQRRSFKEFGKRSGALQNMLYKRDVKAPSILAPVGHVEMNDKNGRYEAKIYVYLL